MISRIIFGQSVFSWVNSDIKAGAEIFWIHLSLVLSDYDWLPVN